MKKEIENSLEVYAKTCEDTQRTLCAAKELVDSAGENMGKIVKAVSSTMLQMKQMDCSFQLMMRQIDNDLDKFRIMVGMVEGQLNTIQTSIKEITAKILSMQNPNMSEKELKAVDSCLRALDIQSNTYNNMIMQLFS